MFPSQFFCHPTVRNFDISPKEMNQITLITIEYCDTEHSNETTYFKQERMASMKMHQAQS